MANRKPPAAGKGRVKGTPNKITMAVREAIQEAFERAGGVDYLLTVAHSDPRVFCTLLAKIVPQKVDHEVNHTVTEIERRIIRAPKPDEQRAVH